MWIDMSICTVLVQESPRIQAPDQEGDKFSDILLVRPIHPRWPVLAFTGAGIRVRELSL